MIGAIIQARMGSTRLPGKVMLPLNGKPMLLYMINRVKRAKLVEKIVVATTMSKEDDIIVNLCKQNRIEFYRGTIKDVAYRYVATATEHSIDTIVRLTADCPFIDPDIIDRCIKTYLDSTVMYVANTAPPESRTFPDGSDVEIFSTEALSSLLMHKSIDKSDREHVTHGFWKNEITKHMFQIVQVNMIDKDMSKYRYTVDHHDDYVVALRLSKLIHEHNIKGTTDEICNLLETHPELMLLNAGHEFGEGWKKQ